MVQEFSDADSSATHGSRSRTSAKIPDASPSCMTASNPSSDNCPDGRQVRTSGASKLNRPKLPRPSGPPPQCPRCSADPSNTKFCYYNNYNINQPRYYCKACQRHWTDGGTLRKVETGAGKRNSRRARGSVSTSEAAASVHNKYAKVSREIPQNWTHENFMPNTSRSTPMVPGAPSYFDTGMADHNSSDANMSFQEGSSFNPDKVMVDEDIGTAQAMADLDVIFANDSLDAILGSAQAGAGDGDASLGTMLGLEVLEDLTHNYTSDADLQQAMDGLSALPDSSKMMHGTSGQHTSGNASGSHTEHLMPQQDCPQHSAPVPDTHRLMPSPTVRSPAPTPPPQGVNVGAAFRNHGRPAPDEQSPAQVMGPPDMSAAMHHLTAQSSEEAGKSAQQPCRPAGFNGDTPSEAHHRPSTPSRAPSEEATLATVVDHNSTKAHASGASWREVQVGCASGTIFTDRGPWAPGTRVVQGQHSGVAVAAAGAKYPAVSGAITSAGMMAVPLGMHGNGQTYAMPAGGFQQFMQPGRGQQMQGGYYMPAQQMSGVRFQSTGRVQQPQMRQVAPGGYYIMHCEPQHGGGMPGMAASAAPQPQHSAQQPRPMQQQSPRAGGGGGLQVVPSAMDRQGATMHSAPGDGAAQEQANQLFAVDHNQQVVLRQQQMYPLGPEPGAVTTSSSPQGLPNRGLQGGPTLVPVASAHSHMYMQQQGDVSGGAAAAPQRLPEQQSVQRMQASTHARTARCGSSGGLVSGGMQASASACSSNPSAASSQSNTAVYVDFRQGGVGAPGNQQPASPQGAPQRQAGQLRGPVFCVAQPQWQHAGRPVYTLQQLQHHSAPVCYVQGGYMPGRQHAVYPSAAAGHRSPRGSTAEQGSEEPEQEQHVLDGVQL